MNRDRRRLPIALACACCAWVGMSMAAAEPVPYTSLQEPDAPTPQPAPDTNAPAPMLPLSAGGASLAAFRELMHAAKTGDASTVSAGLSRLSNPAERHAVQWALIDNAATRVDFRTLDAARKDLAGWPRSSRRQAGAEKAIESSGLGPKAIIDWFDGRDPDTPEGAMALGGALQAVGQIDQAKDVIRHHWREHIFDADLQSRMLARFSSFLTAEDHAARLSTLLYGQQGPAAKAMMDLVDTDHRLLPRRGSRFVRSTTPRPRP